MCVQALQSLSTFQGPQPSVGIGMPHMGQQQGIRQTLQGYGEPAFPRPSSPSGDPAAPFCCQKGTHLFCFFIFFFRGFQPSPTGSLSFSPTHTGTAP